MRPYVVAIFNQKGGISKTTTSTNLAVGLAAYGKSVLVVDLDSQGDSTKSLGVDPAVKKGIYDLFIGGASIDEVILPTMFENVRILPSTYSLAGIEIRLSELQNNQRTLTNILGHASLDFDYVVIDCPPALGILPINALAAAHAVVIPVTATPYANDGLMRTLPSIKYVQEGINKALLLQGVLFTIHDRNKTSRKIADLIRGRLGNTVYQSQIPRDNAVIEAATARLPVCVYAPRSPAAQAHIDFVGEFMERHRKIASKQNVTLPPSASRDGAVETLLRWQTLFADRLGRPDDERLREKQDQLDVMLFGNRTRFERLHLNLIHFLIDNKGFMAVFIVVLLLVVLVLVGAGVSFAKMLAGLFGLG